MPSNPDLPRQIADAIMADREFQGGFYSIGSDGFDDMKKAIVIVIRDYVEAADAAAENSWRGKVRQRYRAARDTLIAAGKERA